MSGNRNVNWIGLIEDQCSRVPRGGKSLSICTLLIPATFSKSSKVRTCLWPVSFSQASLRLQRCVQVLLKMSENSHQSLSATHYSVSSASTPSHWKIFMPTARVKCSFCFCARSFACICQPLGVKTSPQQTACTAGQRATMECSRQQR